MSAGDTVYAEMYGEQPRSLNVLDWPVLGGERQVHGVEGATFASPPGMTLKRRLRLMGDRLTCFAKGHLYVAYDTCDRCGATIAVDEADGAA